MSSFSVTGYGASSLVSGVSTYDVQIGDGGFRITASPPATSNPKVAIMSEAGTTGCQDYQCDDLKDRLAGIRDLIKNIYSRDPVLNGMAQEARRIYNEIATKKGFDQMEHYTSVAALTDRVIYDVDEDMRLGIQEAISILQLLAEKKEPLTFVPNLSDAIVALGVVAGNPMPEGTVFVPSNSQALFVDTFRTTESVEMSADFFADDGNSLNFSYSDKIVDNKNKPVLKISGSSLAQAIELEIDIAGTDHVIKVGSQTFYLKDSAPNTIGQNELNALFAIKNAYENMAVRQTIADSLNLIDDKILSISTKVFNDFVNSLINRANNESLKETYRGLLIS